MISEARLKEICDIYKIDYDKLVDTNAPSSKNSNNF